MADISSTVRQWNVAMVDFLVDAPVNLVAAINKLGDNVRSLWRHYG